jgi:hypothetical protein
MSMLFEIIGHLISSGIGYGAGRFYDWGKARTGLKGQRALLAGLNAESFFVFPYRPKVGDSILPPTATEDFLAINNLISAFHKCGMPVPDHVRNPDNLSDKEKREHSLLLICSPVTNGTTNEYLAKLQLARPDKVLPRFEEYQSGTSKRRRICCGNASYESTSWDQKGPAFDDVALLMKTENPWGPNHRVLLVAGARGIGTRAAAEFVKKWWQELLNHTGGTLAPTDNFVAILDIRYENRDIKFVKVKSCEKI